MKNIDARKSARISTEMRLRSVSLPYYSADLIDISNSGARIKLKGKTAPEALLESRIRFGLSLPAQMSAQLEGYARVVWVRQTEKGIEVGLQWEKLTEDGWRRAQAALELSAA